ncbi:hypothetical protein ADU59_04800 [Pararhizobium polonicum]|uniref:Uncharacterized protein n=1 Tax=Pararhizobium polonicum TaxID=1612624 RepID=A0A1C7P6P6_9HYPH|nr:hypothetical protein [Pararhizobium polonicum]OBZ97015.1 hypothetical protein ADU59_04800 [Pararhizobium polonicum]
MVKQRKWIAMACCLLISVASGYGLWRELAPFLAKPIEQALAADDFSGENFDFGLSSYSKTLAMKDCFRITMAYSNLDMIEEPTRNVVSTCASRAADIVATTPTDSFAWLTRAAASARLLADKDFNDALQQSQLTGPNEQWIARLRVNLAETYFPQLNAQSVKSEEADLRLLASSERGVQLIAQRYISNPDFRARITAVVEQMPQDRQIVFLKTVKKSMGKG